MALSLKLTIKKNFFNTWCIILLLFLLFSQIKIGGGGHYEKNPKIWSPSPSEHFEISVQKPPMLERVKYFSTKINSVHPLHAILIPNTTYVKRCSMSVLVPANIKSTADVDASRHRQTNVLKETANKFL